MCMCWGGLNRQDVPEKSSIQVKLCVYPPRDRDRIVCRTEPRLKRSLCVCDTDLRSWHAAAVWGASGLINISGGPLTLYLCTRRYDARTRDFITAGDTHMLAGGSGHACLHIKNTHTGRHTPVSKLAPSSQAFFRLLPPLIPWLSSLSACQWTDFSALLSGVLGVFELTNQNLIPSYLECRLVNVSL